MSFFESLIAENAWPGATAAVVPTGQAELAVAAGFADREAGRAMDARDRMLAGSVGKTFAAVAAMMLVEDGRIGLDEPITQFSGQLPFIASLPNVEKLTLRLVLAHRTGLANYVNVDDWRARWHEKIARNPDYAQSIEDGIRIAAEAGPVCAPATETRYADTNYLILGRLIEAASGEEYYAFLERRVLEPLGLRSTSPQIARHVPGLVPGYLREALTPVLGPKSIGADGLLIYNPSWEYCGGGLVSTSADLARFMWALFSGRLLSAACLGEMLTAWPMEYALENHRYGLGVQRFESEMGPAYGHTGQFTGYRSVAFYFQRSTMTVAMQVNADAENLLPTFLKLARFIHANGVAGLAADGAAEVELM